MKLNEIEKRGKKMMGSDFVPITEVVRSGGALITKEDLEKIPEEIPFGDTTLQYRKGSHILFLATDSNGNTEWRLESKESIKQLLQTNWKPFLQIGGHRFPLRPFLWPLVKDID